MQANFLFFCIFYDFPHRIDLRDPQVWWHAFRYIDILSKKATFWAIFGYITWENN